MFSSASFGVPRVRHRRHRARMDARTSRLSPEQALSFNEVEACSRSASTISTCKKRGPRFIETLDTDVLPSEQRCISHIVRHEEAWNPPAMKFL
jgi:hypothetical protein